MDYRYFPDPELPAIYVSSEDVERLRRSLPELPDSLRERLVSQYALPEYHANVITETPGAAVLFEQALRSPVVGKIRNPLTMANLLINTVFGELGEPSSLLDDTNELRLQPKQLVSVFDHIDSGKIAHHQGKSIFSKMLESRRTMLVEDFLELKDIYFTPEDKITELVRRLAKDNPNQILQLGGKPYGSKDATLPAKAKPAVLTWFSGNVMRSLKGQADPALMQSVLEKVLLGEYDVPREVFQQWKEKAVKSKRK